MPTESLVRDHRAMSTDNYNEQLYEAICDLVDDGELEQRSSAHKIAMRVAHHGEQSLSDQQKHVYGRDIAPLLKKRTQVQEAVFGS